MAIQVFSMHDASGTPHNFRVDEIDVGGGAMVMWPLTKLTIGAIDSQGEPVHSGNPMPARLYDGSGNALSIVQLLDAFAGTEYGMVVVAQDEDTSTWKPLRMNAWGQLKHSIRDADTDDPVETATARPGSTDRGLVVRPAKKPDTPHGQLTWSSDKALLIGSAARLTGLAVHNPTDADAFLHVYDAASTGAVTLGTGYKLCYQIPAGGSFEKEFSNDEGVEFTSGIVYGQSTLYGGTVGPDDDLNVSSTYHT